MTTLTDIAASVGFTAIITPALCLYIAGYAACIETIKSIRDDFHRAINDLK